MSESDKFKPFLDQVEKLSVLELNELVRALETKFGVSAQVAAAAAPASSPSGAAEEKDEFTVILQSAGANKIQVIRVLKEALGLGLKEAKDLTDAAPAALKEGIKKAEADNLKKLIEDAGGKVELK